MHGQSVMADISAQSQSFTLVFICGLVPKTLPDFISQLWRKSGEGLASLLRHGLEMVDSVSTDRVHVT